MKSLGFLIGLMFSVLQGEFYIRAQIEQQTYDRLRLCWPDTFGIHLEIFKIAVEVKYQKLFLVQAFTKQVLAQACASAYHLPKLNLGMNRLKEYQVYNFRNINACVEHIYRYCNLRLLLFIGKLIKQV